MKSLLEKTGCEGLLLKVCDVLLSILTESRKGSNAAGIVLKIALDLESWLSLRYIVMGVNASCLFSVRDQSRGLSQPQGVSASYLET